MNKIKIPGSKSYTNRALVCAALAEGESIIENPSVCDDTIAMVDALSQLGADIQYDGNFIVNGGRLHPSKDDIDVGAAGTTMRFLTGLCSIIQGEHRIYGTSRMHERPLEDLTNALSLITKGSINLESVNKDGKRCPPITIYTNGLTGGETFIKVDSSSQHLTSLSMAGPYADKDMIIHTIGEPVEEPYTNMTIETMGEFGVSVEKEGRKYIIKAGQRYQPINYDVESDASGGITVMAVPAITGGELSVGEFREDSKQGDLEFTKILEMMGCNVKRDGSYIDVKGPYKLKAVDVDMKDMPDVVPTLAVLAAAADGKTTINNIGNLRMKECDRIEALEQELTKTGIRVESTEDSLTIYGGNPHGAEIDVHDDHRIAMNFYILGLIVPGIKINDMDCVKKSFPNYYELVDGLKYGR
ncbi:MAG: 3-phosphoshikimate 1-carboxyvinyltransferase [Candidatus Woesearchaeota archaeon]